MDINPRLYKLKDVLEILDCFMDYHYKWFSYLRVTTLVSLNMIITCKQSIKSCIL